MASLSREEWLESARHLDWTCSYVTEQELFPEVPSGVPWLLADEWKNWDEPYKTTYNEYVVTQRDKELAVKAVRDALGKGEDLLALDSAWRNGLKLHAAILPLAEFSAVIGNLRAVRFGRAAAWRTMATLGALDETRHTQIPLLLMHEWIRVDKQFDWTHKFFHTNDWVAIAARHLMDELLLISNPIEFAVATNFVFETGFTNLQFIGLSALSRRVGDKMFEKMLASIQTDEARHAQIGGPVLAMVVKHDPAYAQYLVDKWFWRNWLLFSVLTGFSMDYLTPLEKRSFSFKEFVEEWIVKQFLKTLEEFGLKKPWYWDFFVQSMDVYHHMVYASAYSYRSTVWFDLPMPSPEERQWLKKKYPAQWDSLDPVWAQMTRRWQETDPGIEWGTHGTTPVAFCNLCQIVLSNGTPQNNAAVIMNRDGRRYIFCSEPCRWIFEKEPERYLSHKNVVNRILAGEAPGNLLELLKYFGLTPDLWGKDLHGGDYPWMNRDQGNGHGEKK